MTKNNPFDYIKENTNIVEIAEFYRMRVDRHRKTLCPFHDDHNPSMELSKNGKYYKCYACHAWGSAVDLVAKLLDIRPIEAVKKINADFGLGMDLNDDDYSIFIRYQSDAVLDGLRIWCDRKYAECEKALSDHLEYIKTLEASELTEAVEAEAVEKINELSRLMTTLGNGSVKERLELYRKLKGVD